jgi:hypothetical protein
MKKRVQSRRRVTLVGAFALEERVLLSTIGRSAHTQPVADVAKLPRTSHAIIGRGDMTKAPRATRNIISASGQPGGASVSPTARRWSWLANTYWYVPTTNLSAVLYNSTDGSSTGVSDQTVYHITSYRDGYFTGPSVTQLGSSSKSFSSMLGSVTPEGQVLLTFTTTSSNSSPSITEGFGKLTRKFGQWTMENQMFTAPSEKLQIGHWAYMLQTRPGMPSWHSLPSPEVSVPAFMSE